MIRRPSAGGLVVAAALLVCGCSFFDTQGPSESGGGRLAHATIGPEGGTLTHASGAVLTIPAGALSAPIDVTIADADAAPAIDVPGATVAGGAIVLGPEGQTFQRPVLLEMASTAPASGAAPRIYTAPKGSTGFHALDTAVDADTGRLSAHTLHFSTFVPAAPTNANPLFITTSSPLPPATTAVAYGPLALAASGGTAPYGWSLGTGALPPGMSLAAGAISGTPSTSGSFAFSLVVGDSGGQAVEKAFTLTVGSTAPANPQPALTSLSPDTVVVGAPDTQITVSGSGFVNGAYAFVGSTGLSTLFVSATELQAVVPASMLASPGTLQVGVFNPAPGGGTSNTLPLTVSSGLVVTSVTPPAVAAGSGATTITVSGNGFASGSAVTFEDQTLPTTFVSATSLTATIPASALTRVGAFRIRVSNALLGGGVSNAFFFQVVNQVPVILAVSPTALPAGYPTTTLTLNGSDFGSGGTAFLGALALSTQVTSPTVAVATIPASALVNPGTFQLTFHNPAPGGGTSVPFPFSVVTLPAPLTLATAPANSYPQHLAVDATTVYWTRSGASGTGGAFSVPIGGGASTTLSNTAADGFASGIAVGNCDVFWADMGDDFHNTAPAQLLGMPVNGGTPGIVTNTPGRDADLVRIDPATNQIFWSAAPEGTISVMAADGSGQSAVVAGVSALDAFELDSQAVYTVSRGTPGFANGSVQRWPRSGAGASFFANAEHEPHGLALGPTNLYWGTSDGLLRTAPLAGGSASTLVSGEPAITSVATDGTNLFWTTDNDVRTASLAGGTSTVLAHVATGGLHALAVDANNLYWLTSDAVMQLAKPGATGTPATNACAGNPGWALPQVLSAAQGGLDLTTDGTTVYFTDGASTWGTIWAVPANGSAPPTTVAAGQEQPRALQIRGGRLYWVNYGPVTQTYQVYGALAQMSLSPLLPPAYPYHATNVEDLVVDASGSWWVSSVSDDLQHNGTSVWNDRGIFMPQVNSVTSDGTNVYWANISDIYAAPEAGSPLAPTKLASDPDGVFHLRWANGSLYWFSQPGGVASQIRKIPDTGGAAVNVVSGEKGISTFVVDGADLYWIAQTFTNGVASTQLKRLRGGAAAPVVLADQQTAYALAVDASYVYWSNLGTRSLPGNVLRLPKNARP